MVPMVVDRLLVIRDSGNVSTAKEITTSEKYWEKFGRPEWVQLVDTDTPPPGDINYAQALSVTHSSTSESPTIVEEHDKLRQFEFSQNKKSCIFFRYECL